MGGVRLARLLAAVVVTGALGACAADGEPDESSEASTTTDAPTTTSTTAPGPLVGEDPSTLAADGFVLPFEMMLPGGWAGGVDPRSGGAFGGAFRCRPQPTECRPIPPTYPEGVSVAIVALDHLAGVADPGDPRGPFVPAPASLTEWLQAFDGVLEVGAPTSTQLAGMTAQQTDVRVVDIPAGGATLPFWYFGDAGSVHASIEDRTLMRFYELAVGGERIVIAITAHESYFDDREAEVQELLASLQFQ